MSEPVAWAGIWLLVGIGIGRLWQAMRHLKQEQALAGHLRTIANMVPSDTLRETARRALVTCANALEGKQAT